MKKSIILALALAVPAMAGDAKNVTVTVVDVPAIVPAAPAPAFAVEVAGVYNIQQNDINAYYEGIDTYGVDITGVYNINENWSVNMRVGYVEGSRDYYYSSGLDRHHDLFQTGVAGPLTDAVDGAFHLRGTGHDAGQRVGNCQTQVIMAVDGDIHVLHAFHVFLQIADQAVHLIQHHTLSFTHGNVLQVKPIIFIELIRLYLFTIV